MLVYAGYNTKVMLALSLFPLYFAPKSLIDASHKTKLYLSICVPKM